MLKQESNAYIFTYLLFGKSKFKFLTVDFRTEMYCVTLQIDVEIFLKAGIKTTVLTKIILLTSKVSQNILIKRKYLFGILFSRIKDEFCSTDS